MKMEERGGRKGEGRGGRGGEGEGRGGEGEERKGEGRGGERRRGLTHKQTVKTPVPVLERLHKDVLCLVYNQWVGGWERR